MRCRGLVAVSWVALAHLGVACGGGGPTDPPDAPVDISGTWVGVVTQPGGAVSDGFRYRMELSQNDDRIRGSARAETSDTPPCFAEWRVRGTVNEVGEFAFEETRITRESPIPGFDWCLKTADLQYVPGSPESMSGGYQAAPSPCLPGAIDLERR
ncbi:MAG: hypothetical protein ACR2QM_08680 [Longimicrobiales bacterium]